MTQQTRRPEGAPAWIDLATPDREGTHRFYGELFGWTFTDQGEEFGHYEMIRAPEAGDALVGGYMCSTGTTCPDGGPVPIEWSVYLTSHDLDATLARVPGAGGRAVMDPMPVGDQGTMTFVVDPAGTRVGLWQPGTLDGGDLPLAPGTPVWFEAMTTEFDASLAFYRDALGWDVHWTSGAPGSGEEWRYVTLGGGDGALAGLCDASAVIDTDPYWRVYLSTVDIDGDLTRIADLGASVLDGPMDSPFGRLATIRDPQGATFQLIQNPSNTPQ